MAKEALIEVDANEVAEQIVVAAEDADNEQELMMNAAPALKGVLDKLGIATMSTRNSELAGHAGKARERI